MHGMNDLSQIRSQLRTDQEYVLGFKRSDLENVRVVQTAGPVAEQQGTQEMPLTPEAKAELLTLLHVPTVAQGQQIQPSTMSVEIISQQPISYDSWSQTAAKQFATAGSGSGSSSSGSGSSGSIR